MNRVITAMALVCSLYTMSAGAAGTAFPGATPPPSGWQGPYNIVCNNCHNAANCGVASGTACGITTGILSCQGNNTGIGGHTVNWQSTQCAVPGGGPPDPNCTTFCVYEPQRVGDVPCCWNQTGAAYPGNANVTAGAGLACAQNKCGAQAAGGQVCLAAGQCFGTNTPDPLDCKNTNAGNQAACITCCANATHGGQWWPALPFATSWCSSLKPPAGTLAAYNTCIANNVTQLTAWHTQFINQCTAACNTIPVPPPSPLVWP